jgi:dihydroorotase-like cyclic amidohydrolase
VEALLQKKIIAERQALVDFGIYGLIGETNHNQLKPMAEAGAISFKLYMGSENPVVPCPPDGAILEAFETLATHCSAVRKTITILNAMVRDDVVWADRLSGRQRAGRSVAVALIDLA